MSTVLTPATETAVDPVTLEVIRHGLASIAGQIEANITRTAFSPHISEYKDYAVGLVGTDGYLVAQARGGIPIFVADSVGTAVRDGLQIYGIERLHHGDVVLCNAAAVQGQHLNNVVMYTPIWAGADGKTLLGFFAINAHWGDIGGAAVGAGTYRSTDIFMEGLQLRSVKLESRGEPIEEVYRIIASNSRFPEELLGDIAAQLSGCLMGRDLTIGLAEKYGIETFLAATRLILERSEQLSRAKIRQIPNGEYSAEGVMDNDGVADDPIPLKVRVIIDDDEMTVDFTGMAPQRPRGFNSGRHGGGESIARLAFKYLIGIDESANEGTFRPLKVILPEGTIISASDDAPMAQYNAPIPTTIDLILKALAPAVPERIAGGHFGSHSSLSFYRSRSLGRPFKSSDSGHGGWGACATHDGGGPFRTMSHGDTRIVPIEVQETRVPFRVEEFRLRTDSGGPGKFRGGLGFVRRYRMLGPCLAFSNVDRHLTEPWGVQGGRPGVPGRITVYKKGASEPEVLFKIEDYLLEEGDVIVLETGGGGGYGPPEERARELVERDLSRGYISREAAERDYGLKLPNGR
ncbi:MAG TPA: hydantoinase B/oxoprolinase family protein [Candidatus Binatia bacterium]|nr:hydantoinase B/oxoprolinase family protein [Candidatus Binatia bacterium]